MSKHIPLLVIIAITGTASYAGVQHLTKNPCEVPTTFTIEHIDPRFNLATSTLLSYTKEAASVWNNAYATNTLLVHKEQEGNIAIKLVYDTRQETTNTHQKLRDIIEKEKEELTESRETLESLQARYATLQKETTTKTSSYERNLKAYNDEVAYWNARGGAPDTTYRKLENRATNLENERTELNQDIEVLNALVIQIQKYGNTHNTSVTTLNEKITTLNKTAIREFEEGSYDPQTKTITIYEYGSVTALKRVLIHEFGHALSLHHVEDTDAIMYPINQGKNLSLTEDDREELANVCREKTLTDILDSANSIRDDIFHLVQSSWRDIAARLP